jgi:hypothetical protein
MIKLSKISILCDIEFDDKSRVEVFRDQLKKLFTCEGIYFVHTEITTKNNDDDKKN